MAVTAKKRSTASEVYAYCDEDHCDDLDVESCPHLTKSIADRPAIQAVFEQHGPPSERLCDWFRSTEEPWFSLSRALGYER